MLLPAKVYFYNYDIKCASLGQVMPFKGIMGEEEL
jgi:hypothetical protein